MKKILFATTALATVAFGGVASAEIALFGDARLGVGYGINNDGTADLEANSAGTKLENTDDLRAVSRVRFGVTMTGESDSGITFGATIRADNARGGQGDDNNGQTAGDVFVSGAWGTLTFGDTNGADEQHVGDAGGFYALTGLGDLFETAYISNGGGFGDDDRINFANDPEARPTVRYDYNFGGLGVSASTNRDLNDVGVGASYTFEFANGSVTGGLGYYDFNEFDTTVLTLDPDTGIEAEEEVTVRGGEQYSVGLKGTFGGFSGGVIFSAAKTESASDRASGDLDVLYLNAAYTFDAWSVGGFYNNILTGNGNLDVYDGLDAYGIGVAYDLGGGASVNAGLQKNYGRNADADVGIVEIEDSVVADFGIKMAF